MRERELKPSITGLVNEFNELNLKFMGLVGTGAEIDPDMIDRLLDLDTWLSENKKGWELKFPDGIGRR